MSKMFEIWE